MDQQEDNQRAQQRNDGINSVYPKMDLKTVGGMTKSQNKISRNSSFSNSDTVQEELDRDEPEKDDMTQSQSKSKFKHVNIITDSDEFNQHKGGEQQNTLTVSQMQRIRSTSSDQAFGESIQEDKIEEEVETTNSPSKLSTSKLGIMTHPIEEAMLLDKGEFDCSTPTRPKPSSLMKKASSQIQYAFNQKEETITEDPEKETDGIFVARISSHKEIKIKVDEIDTDKSKQFTPRVNYMENSVPIIEETKEEDLVEGNKQFQTAKQEREQEMGYIKKIVKGDTIREGEKLVHMAETSGMTSHMTGNQINENQQDEDIEDTEDKQDVIDALQKRRRSSLNIDNMPQFEEVQENQ